MCVPFIWTVAILGLMLVLDRGNMVVVCTKIIPGDNFIAILSSR